jgi:hypothetical protein
MASTAGPLGSGKESVLVTVGSVSPSWGETWDVKSLSLTKTCTISTIAEKQHVTSAGTHKVGDGVAAAEGASVEGGKVPSMGETVGAGFEGDVVGAGSEGRCEGALEGADEGKFVVGAEGAGVLVEGAAVGKESVGASEGAAERIEGEAV